MARESPLRSEVIMGGLSRRKCCFMYGVGGVQSVSLLRVGAPSCSHSVPRPGLSRSSIEGGCHSTESAIVPQDKDR